jgi:hypothetical protein
MAKLSFSKIEIFILLLLIVQAFNKSILSIIISHGYYGFNLVTTEWIVNLFKIFSTIMNICFILIAFYLLIIKKARSITYLIICALLIFKALMHFLVDNNLYKYLNLSNDDEQKLILFKKYETALTNLFIGLLTLYIIYTVFA